MADVAIKRGDLGHVITRTLVRKTITDVIDLDTGIVSQVTTYALIDLTTATQVKLLLKDTTSAQTGGGLCTFVDRPGGIVRYVTVTADTTAVRTWNAEYEITWATGAVETVPNEAPADRTVPYYTVEITPDLG